MIKWSKRALKHLDHLDANSRERILTAVLNLPNGDIKALTGKLKGLYRLRVGQWRVIFMRQGSDFIILDVLHRKDAYR